VLKKFDAALHIRDDNIEVVLFGLASLDSLMICSLCGVVEGGGKLVNPSIVLNTRCSIFSIVSDCRKQAAFVPTALTKTFSR